MKRLAGLEQRGVSLDDGSGGDGGSSSSDSGRNANPIGSGAVPLHFAETKPASPSNNEVQVLDTESHPLDCAAIIEGDGSSSPSKAPFTRGHRRRSTHVTRRDLEKFQKEVLGVENHASYFDEENGTSRPINPYDPQLEELNRAFSAADLSMNNTAGMAANGSASGMFSGYVDNSPSNSNMGSVPRQSMSPALSHPSAQVNGGGMGSFAPGMSMNAGHQMDLHHLYDMVLELSDVLKNNREVTKNIVSSAEDIMVCWRIACRQTNARGNRN